MVEATPKRKFLGFVKEKETRRKTEEEKKENKCHGGRGAVLSVM